MLGNYLVHLVPLVINLLGLLLIGLWMLQSAAVVHRRDVDI